MTILNTETVSQIKEAAKFVRDGEIIGFGDLLDSHFDICTKHNLGEPMKERFQRLVDDAGRIAILGDRIIFRSSSVGCKTRQKLTEARLQTKPIAEKILGREVGIEF